MRTLASPFVSLFVSLFVTLALALPAVAAVPKVVVESIVKDSVGGDYTQAMVVMIKGKKVFLKSLKSKPLPVEVPGGGTRPMQLTRWANFESDILARDLFEIAGVQCPRSTVVRLDPASEPGRRLGTTALAMEFVDAKLVRGEVKEGYWPGKQLADLDGFTSMALVDFVMGNADRRDPNYFVAVGSDGIVRPVPIDNNSGFCSFMIWVKPSNLVNFFPSYEGVGRGWPYDVIGTIKNVIVRGGETHHVHENLLRDRSLRARTRTLTAEFVAKLTDARIDEMVAALPPEMLPEGLSVDTNPSWLVGQSADRTLLFGNARGVLTGSALFAARCAEIKRVLRYRRDNLGRALEAYWKTQDGGAGGVGPIVTNPGGAPGVRPGNPPPGGPVGPRPVNPGPRPTNPGPPSLPRPGNDRWTVGTPSTSSNGAPGRGAPSL